jgi:hypothetical protein
MLRNMNRPLLAMLMLVLGLAPICVDAGAWPREKGKTFLALSASVIWPKQRAIELPDIYGSAYVEHGLGARFTLGLDVGSPDATRQDRLKTIAFLRYTVTPSSTKHQLAFDIGGGTFQALDVLRFGASYGTGFTSFEHNSWITIDAHALHHSTLRNISLTVDATYGVSLKRGKLMAQISGFQSFDGRKTAKFSPSYAHDIGHGRHIEIGVNIDLHNAPDPTLKLGIWQEF